MTREKEILNAATEARMASAETLTTRGTHHSIDDIPFIDEMITYDEVAENAFIKGAEWADNHPINVWHNVSEEPLKGRVFLAELGASAYGFQTFVSVGNNIEFNWNEWVKEIRLLRWAYIDDLLLKGNKE